MNSREIEEYIVLRATIRERGTARVWIFVVGLALWGGLVIATAASMSLPVATLLPLLILAAVFEAVYALHTGIERIGRYIQVFHETGWDNEASSRAWEHVAMAFGQSAGSAGPDPLFGIFFWLAALGNVVPAMLAGAVSAEWAVIGLAHAIFIGRVTAARHRASRQRALDLELFQKLKSARQGHVSAPAQS